MERKIDAGTPAECTVITEQPTLAQTASVVLGFGLGYLAAGEAGTLNQGLHDGMRSRLNALNAALGPTP